MDLLCVDCDRVSSVIPLPSCLIHDVSSHEDIYSNLTSPHNYESWTTLLEAARSRKFVPLLELAATVNEGVIPPIRYHSACRNTFVYNLKNVTVTIDRIDYPSLEKSNKAPSVQNRQQRQSDRSGDKCVFCSKGQLYLKKQTPVFDRLVVCLDFRVDGKLCEYLKSTEMMQKLCAAAMWKVKYHTGCYEKYEVDAGMKNIPRCESEAAETFQSQLVPRNVASEQNFSCVETEAFQFIVKHINEVGLKKEILSLTDVNTMFISRAAELGKTDEMLPSTLTEAELNEKLKQEFEDRLNFCCAENGEILMYPHTLNVDELVRKVLQLMRENAELKQENSCLKHELDQRPPAFQENTTTTATAATQDVDGVQASVAAIEDVEDTETLLGGMGESFGDMFVSLVPMVTEVESVDTVCGAVTQNMEDVSASVPIAENVHPFRRCVCHVRNKENDKFSTFTEKTWNKLCKYMAIWKDLDGLEQAIAATFDAGAAVGEGYHAYCFKVFTEKRNVANAYKRLLLTRSKTATDELSVNLPESISCDQQNLARNAEYELEDGASRCLPASVVNCNVPATHTDDALYSIAASDSPLLTMTAIVCPPILQNLTASLDATAASSDGCLLEQCFETFADKQTVELAQLKAKMGNEKTTGSATNSAVDSEHRTVVKSKSSRCKSKPGECFLCHSMRYYPDSKNGTRKATELRCCTSGENGNSLQNLRLAAREKGDQAVLEYFRRLDEEPGFVLKYHNSCCRTYGRDNPHPNQCRSEREARFKQFMSDVVEKRVIEDGEMLTVNVLTDMFITIVDPTATVKASDAEFDNWKLIMKRQVRKRLGDRIASVHVHGEASNFLASTRTVQQILAKADLNEGCGMEIDLGEDYVSAGSNERTSSLPADHPEATNSLVSTQSGNVYMGFLSNVDCSKTVNDAAEHREPEDTEPKYLCIGCHELFESTTDLEAHRSKSSKCAARYNEFIERAKSFDVDVGIAQSIPELPAFECDICLKRYRTSALVTRHKNTKHRRADLSQVILNLFVCDLCHEWFRQRTTFDDHMQTHSLPVVNSCRICGKVFGLPGKLTQHMEEHDGRPVKKSYRRYRCQECDTWLGTEKGLKRHVLRHATGRTKVPACNICGKKFKFPSALENHMKYHSESRPYCCDQCGKQFVSAGHLAAHVSVHSEVRPFVCEFCSASFRRKQNLKHHVTLFHGETLPYVCPDCGTGYPSLYRLKEHAASHMEVKPLACDICSKRFGTMPHLKQHMKSHTKPLQCHLCQRRFAVAMSLQQHLEMHAAEAAMQRQYYEVVRYPVEEAYYADTIIESDSEETDAAAENFRDANYVIVELVTANK